ncbi:hypothetical protein CDAR_410581 [Caerostris darwini]|uniref:Uncharacterized protein n=1 Tax=Caerostris darwini TaxID=1538125 RepID=A0AAV4N8F5_9ARAC|nr:hypothetical protein CDAR_410581 [Caerostris darwini]
MEIAQESDEVRVVHSYKSIRGINWIVETSPKVHKSLENQHWLGEGFHQGIPQAPTMLQVLSIWPSSKALQSGKRELFQLRRKGPQMERVQEHIQLQRLRGPQHEI